MELDNESQLVKIAIPYFAPYMRLWNCVIWIVHLIKLLQKQHL